MRQSNNIALYAVDAYISFVANAHRIALHASGKMYASVSINVKQLKHDAMRNACIIHIANAFCRFARGAGLRLHLYNAPL